MEMPDDKLFFAPIWKITEKLYENINKRQISPTTHHCSAGKITSVRSARYAFCDYGRSAFTVIDEFNRLFRIHSRGVSQARER